MASVLASLLPVMDWLRTGSDIKNCSLIILIGHGGGASSIVVVKLIIFHLRADNRLLVPVGHIRIIFHAKLGHANIITFANRVLNLSRF